MQGVYHDSLGEQESVGNARYASIWNQKTRNNCPQLGWERNLRTGSKHRRLLRRRGDAASLEVGAIQRVQRWLTELPPPRLSLRTAGGYCPRRRALSVSFCFNCHDRGGNLVGKVTPISQIGTDDHRLNSYTERLNTLFQGRGLSRMTVTRGYLNGIPGWCLGPRTVPAQWFGANPVGLAYDG